MLFNTETFIYSALYRLYSSKVLQEVKALKEEEETFVNFAIVAKGTLDDFNAVKTFLKGNTTAHMVYQTTGYDKLFIKRGGENE
jgi:hypothetical protein